MYEVIVPPTTATSFAALPHSLGLVINGWIAVASLIVGVLGIVIGGVLAFWFYRKGKNWHQIIYQVVSDRIKRYSGLVSQSQKSW